MIELKNISKSYVSRSGYVTKALKNLSVTLPSRGLVFILGRSGSGKSTLLNILGGIDTPNDGEIIIDGRSTADFTREDYDSYRNSYVGFVFQEYNLLPEYTVGENVALALELKGKQNDRGIVDDALRRVELVDVGGSTLYARNVKELSGGQKQRVAVARALIKDPKLILADEPCGALDSKTGVQLYELLKKLSENKLVVVITHDCENAEKYGDRIIRIADGSIISDDKRGIEKVDVSSNYSSAKSHLPFGRTVSMGVSGLKSKKFRLVTSILLTVIAVSIFGFALTVSLTDPLEVELHTLFDLDMRTILLSTACLDSNGNSTAAEPNSEQYEKLLEYTGGNEPIKVIGASAASGLGEIEDYIADEESSFYLSNPYYSIGMSNFSFLAEVDYELDAAEAGLIPDERLVNSAACRLPRTYNEIAITDIRASMFIQFGYIGVDGATVKIERPDDLIGLKLGEFTICGVYSTEFDRKYFERYTGRQNVPDESKEFYNLAYGAQTSVMTFGFVAEGFSENAGINTNSYMLVMNGNVGRDCGFIRSLTNEAGDSKYIATIRSAATPLTSFVPEFKKILLKPFLIIAASFSLLSVLLTMSFLMVVFDFKKRELGILRALGARSKDILRICLVESSIIAVSEYVMSMLCVCFGCLIINFVNSAALFFVGIPVVFAILGLCLGVSALATIVPILRLIKKKPIDIINNK